MVFHDHRRVRGHGIVRTMVWHIFVGDSRVCIVCGESSPPPWNKFVAACENGCLRASQVSSPARETSWNDCRHLRCDHPEAAMYVVMSS